MADTVVAQVQHFQRIEFFGNIRKLQLIMTEVQDFDRGHSNMREFDFSKQVRRQR